MVRPLSVVSVSASISTTGKNAPFPLAVVLGDSPTVV